MIQHKYSLQDLESMMPWERDVHVALMVQRINELIEEANAK